jgi:hypothetical protein
MVSRIEGLEDLQRVADALKEAGDKDLQNKVSAALRNQAKPLGLLVLRTGAAEMPHRGGLSGRVSGMGRVGVSSALKGRVSAVSVILRNKGVDLKSMDAGVLRHPVFGNRSAWVRQSVPSGAFSRAFDAEALVVQRAATKAAQDVLDDVARKV